MMVKENAMTDASKREANSNVADPRLYVLPDPIEVINNMDGNTRAPLTSIQLWEVEDGPVVIDAPSGESRIFLRAAGKGWTRGRRCLKEGRCHLRCLKKDGPVWFRSKNT